MQVTADLWNALSVSSREKLIRRDRSMRSPRWAHLVVAMSSRRYEELPALQQGAVNDLVAKYMLRGGGR